MNVTATNDGQPATPNGNHVCLARSVAEAFREDNTLEAVTIHRDRSTLSVATLGRADEAGLAKRIQDKFESARNNDPQHACSLLSGGGDCSTCDNPLSEQERRAIT
ncbi:MAG TPA: hypothetical protein PKA41_16845, partial [Verrucomicrobiota bacterium]|nr:hypothetical protein [Verrucomicrobiota bacterium]